MDADPYRPLGAPAAMGVAAAGPPGPAEGAMPYVRIAGLTKRFGDFVAVRQVSLDVRRGEIFCLLGGSGCGKTTLLRMLAGFESPSEGAIYIDGVDVTAVPPYERPVNMMFQSYALFPHMTVTDNVAFGLRQDHVPRAEINARVAEILALVRLEGYDQRKPHQLSGGQRQRVALARALIKRPKLLLLDEPLGALDKKLREHTQFELVNLQERLGVTFIIVTHDQEEAMTLAGRIGVMRNGEILQVGTPTDIYEFPNSRYVADFIGSVNLVEGRLVEDEPDHVRIECPQLGATIYVAHGVSAAPGGELAVAIRPEKLQLGRERPLQPDNVLQGVIDGIAYLGDLTRYLVRLPTGCLLRVTAPNVFRHEERLAHGEAVWLHWHESAAVVVTR
jgi:putrescine transport system ATP-binding protein